MKTAPENTRNQKSGKQAPAFRENGAEKVLSKKAAEMKIFLANNPVPKEFLK